MANKKSKDENKNEEIVTEEEVWDIIRFARAMSGGMYGSAYLTPDLVSGRLKDITLNPMAATTEMLDKAIANPKASETQLQEFSQSFELSSMIYKRLISYLSNMLSFDITYTSNAKPDDYTSPKYKKAVDALETFLDRFKYKLELRKVVREMLRNDAYFGCFIDTGDNYVLQELPSEYCKITGRWGNGFLFSFNMYWFIQPGVDINQYPSFFKRKFKELFSSSNTTQRYQPSLSPELRERSSWIYWVDVPVTLGVCFKLTPELATRLPYFTPLFSDLVLQGLMRNLQKNMNMAAASKMIIGEVPMLNRDAKATVKDSISISPELLGKFMALVKSAISDSIKVASAPLNNIDEISFETDNKLYDSYLRTTLASSGINTNLIFTSDVKPNTIETQLSLNVDEQTMTSLYDQFEDFMNYFINRDIKSFKFKINFEGTDFFLNRKERFETVMSLFDKGIILPQKIAASLGMKPHELRKQMEESSALDFMKSVTPPALEGQKEMVDKNKEATLETQEQAQEAAIKTQKIAIANKPPPAVKAPQTSAPKGRPQKSESELGEEGAQTRAQGTNIGRGGKV